MAIVYVYIHILYAANLIFFHWKYIADTFRFNSLWAI